MLNKDINKLQKRAKRKYINTPVLQHLIDLNSILKTKYISSTYCSSLITQTDGKICSRYCKRMWCTVCAPIKTAIRLNKYRPHLDKLGPLTLTTLTIPNVPGSKLRSTVQHFRKIFRAFRDLIRKTCPEIMRGVYNFEVTFNNFTKLYHPHIHIIHTALDTRVTKLPNGEQKNINSLIDYWLSHEPTAKLVAQDTRPCTDFIEGFKYSSKSVFYIKKDNRKLYIIPAVELNKLYEELQGLRCFQSFGIDCQLSEAQEDKLMNELTAYETGKQDGCYLWSKYDWFCTQIHNLQGERIYVTDGNTPIIETTIELSNFKPNKKQIQIHEQLANNAHY